MAEADQPLFGEEARERLRALVKAAGGLKVADGVPMPRSTLQKMMEGSGDIGAGRLSRLAKRLGVTLDYIMDGTPIAAADDQAETVTVPIVEGVEASAGPGRAGDVGTVEMGGLSFPRSYLLDAFGTVELAIIRARGDSQLPEISDGDLVMYDQRQTRPSEGLHLVRLDGDLLIKRLQLLGRRIRLLSNNPAYEPVEVDLAEGGPSFAVLGKVVWAGRDLR